MTAYFEGLSKLLGHVQRRASFAMYAAGLLSDLERKSVEPIAALASKGSPKRCALYHHRLLNLLNTSPWSDEDVRGYAAEYALRALTKGVLADRAYGSCARFRGEVTLLGLPHALGVLSSVVVRRIDACGRRLAPVSAKALAEGLRKKHWREVTWLEGTKAPLRSRFALVEVEVANADPNEPVRQRLLIEWPEGEKEPTHCTFVTLPAEKGLREIVRVTKARWRVERTYEDLKGELGLDHYEGRSWVGWQHHVSAVLACYALVVACQRRAFSPLGPRGA